MKFHFNTCKNVSEKNPGEKLPGCPSWTLTEDEDVEEDGEDGDGSQENSNKKN